MTRYVKTQKFSSSVYDAACPYRPNSLPRGVSGPVARATRDLEDAATAEELGDPRVQRLEVTSPFGDLVHAVVLRGSPSVVPDHLVGHGRDYRRPCADARGRIEAL